MAQSEDQKKAAAEQANLFGELEKSDVKVSGEAAEKMKDNIVNDRGASNYLGLGVHEVFVKSVELVKANSGTLGMQINVENADGLGRATFWLSEAALPYTIENVSRLVVHNTAEDKKAAARTFMANITSPKEIFNVAKEKLDGGVAYLSIKESKTQTYTDKKTGEIKPSLETNLTSWKPKEDVQQSATKAMGGGAPLSEAEKSEIPF